VIDDLCPNLPDPADPSARADRLRKLYAEAQSRIEQVHRRGNVDPATLEKWRLALSNLATRWAVARAEADAAAAQLAAQAGEPVQQPLPDPRGPRWGGQVHRR
jgi:hypothetical protein